MASRKDNQKLQAPGRAPQEHPLFSGQTSVGIISGENPRFAAQFSGHEVLGRHLKQMGLRAEPRQGRYGYPEKSWMVYGPTREQMFRLGRRFGQESVVYSQGGKHELLYTNGPNAGRYHPALSYEWFDREPEDYYTYMPELGGYLRLNFDWDVLHPSNLAQPEAIEAQRIRAAYGTSPAPHHPEASTSPLKKAGRHAARRSSLPKNLKRLRADFSAIEPTSIIPSVALTRLTLIRPVRLAIPFLKNESIRVAPHPHAYDWHNGHTDHHLHHVAPGVILRSRDQWLAKAQAHPHMDGSKPPEPKTSILTPPAGTDGHPTNDQVAHVGVSTYAKYAMPFGRIDKQHPTDLFHYPYHGKNEEIDRLVKEHGYSVYYAGGKYGRPDLANRNYNTKHLMIYDPSPDSGANFGVERYTDAWRKIHELSHALVYPELNKIYGEGRRIGKLGYHRTLREALRAVHWEWLACHKQRELSQQIGVHIPDHVFNKELNTVMHDAVHRAVTGKFTEPAGEGFHPHAHKVPLETALGMVREAAHNLGITGMHDLVQKSEDNMVDDKVYEEREWRMALAKGIRERVDAYSRSLLELRQRELKKSLGADAALVGPAPQMMPVDVCPLCGQEDMPGKCKCLARLPDGFVPAAPLAKKDNVAKPPAPSMAKAQVCKAHGKKGCVEKNCGSPIMDQPKNWFVKRPAKKLGRGKKGESQKSGDEVMKEELAAKEQEPAKPAKGNGVKIRAPKSSKASSGAKTKPPVLDKGPDLWAGEGVPEHGEGMAPKPKFGLAHLAAGKAKLQAAGVKLMSPLAAPKPAAPAVGGMKPHAAKPAFGKSKSEIADLKKALGQCVLCKKPEHMGQCS